MDLSKAKCSREEDTKMITSKIVDSSGGWKELNHKMATFRSGFDQDELDGQPMYVDVRKMRTNCLTINRLAFNFLNSDQLHPFSTLKAASSIGSDDDSSLPL